MKKDPKTKVIKGWRLEVFNTNTQIFYSIGVAIHKFMWILDGLSAINYTEKWMWGWNCN